MSEPTEAMLAEARELAATMYGPRPADIKLRVGWDGRSYALAAGMAHAAALIETDLGRRNLPHSPDPGGGLVMRLTGPVGLGKPGDIVASGDWLKSGADGVGQHMRIGPEPEGWIEPDDLNNGEGAQPRWTDCGGGCTRCGASWAGSEPEEHRKGCPATEPTKEEREAVRAKVEALWVANRDRYFYTGEPSENEDDPTFAELTFAAGIEIERERIAAALHQRDLDRSLDCLCCSCAADDLESGEL